MIPLVKPFIAPAGEMMPEIEKILYSGYIAEGEKVYEFERTFGTYIENPNVLSLNSGTAALHIALMLAGGGPGGEPYSGQVAVGAVVLNRIKHPSFPNTLSGVIYQSGAFTCITDGQFNQPVAESAYRAARDALNGVDPSGGAIYYFNPSTATSSWIWSRPLITVIGKHRFCS